MKDLLTGSYPPPGATAKVCSGFGRFVEIDRAGSRVLRELQKMIDASQGRTARSPSSTPLWISGAALAAWLVTRLWQGGGSLNVGRDAPDFDLPIVANADAIGTKQSTVSLRSLRGHPVLLVFWATWCGPCREEAPSVNAASQKWRDRGVVVLGVNTEDQGDPREFALSQGLTYPILRDASSDAARAYGVEGLPTIVMISSAGKIVGTRVGETEEGGLDTLIHDAL